MSADHVGLYGPDTVTWRVNREAVLLAGGGRALLLQVAHPLVAAGVEQHSNYDSDPWGRLIRTLDLTTKIVFGSAKTAEEASQRLQKRHTTVHGVAEDGTPYDARDPDLLLWVWATLVESSLLVYQRYVRPLKPADIERYYDEQTRFAVACGVPDGHWPDTFADFVEYYDRTIEEDLVVGEAARRVARSVLHPDVPAPLRPVFAGVLELVTVGLLPPILRERYELDWGPRRERLLAASTASIRRALPLLPSLLREFPPARSARRRVRAAA
jgi:uncharacterized protein (DUF2236 family)